ncbi:Rieske 2Fe-2S domain-containing protein [Streptomyces olivoreticuli]
MKTVPLAGKEVVIYRTRKGVLKAVDPYCPHLGAHLGVGGKAEGEQLVCPFHQFRFSVDGVCVATPYGNPPKASLTAFPVEEKYGIVWVWTHHAGEPPTWQPSDGLVGIGDTAPQAHRQVDLAGYPQDVAENVADYGHFPTLHGMETFEVALPIRYSGPFARIEVRVRRRFPLVTLESHIHGQLLGLAGFAAVLGMPRLPYRVVTWVLPTPTGPARMRLNIAVTTDREIPGRRGSGTPHRALVMGISRFVLHQTMRDLKPDLDIWHHRRPDPHPRLSSADGPIGLHRKWARQFYPEPDPCGDGPV